MAATCVFLVLFAFGIHFYSSDAAICGWDNVWYNNSTPSAANNFTDTEVLPDAKILASVCEAEGMLQIRCQASGNLSFEFVHNDTSRQYFATCIAVIGLICKPWEGITGASCPDFSIQIGCVCPTTIAPASTTQTGVVPGATPVGLFSTGVTQRSGFSTGGIGKSSNGHMSGAGNTSGIGNGAETVNISDSGQTSAAGHNSGTGNTSGTGSGVVTGHTNSTGNRNGTFNGITGGKGNAGGSGQESGTTGNGNETGSFETESGCGSLDGNSKSLIPGDKNGSASKERNIVAVCTFVLLTLYGFRHGSYIS